MAKKQKGTLANPAIPRCLHHQTDVSLNMNSNMIASMICPLFASPYQPPGKNLGLCARHELKPFLPWSRCTLISCCAWCPVDVGRHYASEEDEHCIMTVNCRTAQHTILVRKTHKKMWHDTCVRRICGFRLTELVLILGPTYCVSVYAVVAGKRICSCATSYYLAPIC